MDYQIVSALQRGNNVIKIELSLDDLHSFADHLVEKTINKAKEELNNEDALLTKKEVMDTLGISDTTIWHWNKNHYLHPIKIGRKVMYKKSDIHNHLLSTRENCHERNRNLH